MAKNWTAYEAAKEIYGENKETIAEIGGRYPLFTRTVLMANSEYILDILKALPKVTARVVETGLKGIEVDVETDAVEEVDVAKEKKVQKAKSEPDDDFEDEVEGEGKEASEYDSMTAKALYALCCERGISSHCKSRSKAALIEVLTKHDAGEFEESGRKAKKTETKKAKAKKVEPVEDDVDDWDDDEDVAEDSDPYAGKTAKELFTMCKERGIKVKPKQSADAYAKLLKDYDMNDDTEDEEDEDDEWEI